MYFDSILHIDLLDTDLDDFAEHVRRNIGKIVLWFRFGEVSNEVHISPYSIYWDVSRKSAWDKASGIVEGRLLTGTVYKSNIRLTIEEFGYGTTECRWMARWDTTLLNPLDRTEMIDAEDDIEQWEPIRPDATDVQSGNIFLLTALRFRRNRLKIILSVPSLESYEARKNVETRTQFDARTDLETSKQFEARKQFIKWVEMRWGGAEDGYRELDAKDAPTSISGEPMPLLGVRTTLEKWFAWFGWYYREYGSTPVASRLAHMAQVSGKSLSRVENMHALYMEDKK